MVVAQYFASIKSSWFPQKRIREMLLVSVFHLDLHDMFKHRSERFQENPKTCLLSEVKSQKSLMISCLELTHSTAVLHRSWCFVHGKMTQQNPSLSYRNKNKPGSMPNALHKRKKDFFFLLIPTWTSCRAIFCFFSVSDVKFRKSLRF